MKYPEQAKAPCRVSHSLKRSDEETDKNKGKKVRKKGVTFRIDSSDDEEEERDVRKDNFALRMQLEKMARRHPDLSKVELFSLQQDLHRLAGFQPPRSSSDVMPEAETSPKTEGEELTKRVIKYLRVIFYSF